MSDKKTFYNLQSPATGGGVITLDGMDMVIDQIRHELLTQGTLDPEDPLVFILTPVQMTEEEFKDLPEFQF